jgi:hypothetical protein
VRVTLLADIRTVFRIRGADRTSSAALVEALRELDNGLWSEWRGPNDDRPPHKLTQGELAQLLVRLGSGRRRYGRCNVGPGIEAPAATSPRNSRQHGRHTATRVAQRHGAAKSYGCRGYDPTPRPTEAGLIGERTKAALAADKASKRWLQSECGRRAERRIRARRRHPCRLRIWGAGVRIPPSAPINRGLLSWRQEAPVLCPAGVRLVARWLIAPGPK